MEIERGGSIQSSEGVARDVIPQEPGSHHKTAFVLTGNST